MKSHSREKLIDEAIRVLEAVPEDLLHMRAFTESSRCGTAHCLAGWLAVDPWFRENTAIGKIFDSEGHPVKSVWSSDLSPILKISIGDAETLFALTISRLSSAHAVSKKAVMDNLLRLRQGRRLAVRR